MRQLVRPWALVLLLLESVRSQAWTEALSPPLVLPSGCSSSSQYDSNYPCEYAYDGPGSGNTATGSSSNRFIWLSSDETTDCYATAHLTITYTTPNEVRSVQVINRGNGENWRALDMVITHAGGTTTVTTPDEPDWQTTYGCDGTDACDALPVWTDVADLGTTFVDVTQIVYKPHRTPETGSPTTSHLLATCASIGAVDATQSECQAYGESLGEWEPGVSSMVAGCHRNNGNNVIQWGTGSFACGNTAGLGIFSCVCVTPVASTANLDIHNYGTTNYCRLNLGVGEVKLVGPASSPATFADLGVDAGVADCTLSLPRTAVAVTDGQGYTGITQYTPVQHCASSTYDVGDGNLCGNTVGHASGNVIDGNTGTSWASGLIDQGSGTRYGAHPHWVSIDLGAEYSIATVYAKSRASCCGEWTGGTLFVRLTTTGGTDPDAGLVNTCEITSTGLNGQEHTVACAGVARYVYLYSNDMNNFQVAELSAQSPPGVATNEIMNGVLEADWAMSAAATAIPNQWVMIDMGAEYTVTSLGIWTRAGCCQDRFQSHSIRIGNVANTPLDASLTVCEHTASGTVSYYHEACAGTGRYVYIYSNRNLGADDDGNYLTLREVEIYGTDSLCSVAACKSTCEANRFPTVGYACRGFVHDPSSGAETGVLGGGAKCDFRSDMDTTQTPASTVVTWPVASGTWVGRIAGDGGPSLNECPNAGSQMCACTIVSLETTAPRNFAKASGSYTWAAWLKPVGLAAWAANPTYGGSDWRDAIRFGVLGVRGNPLESDYTTSQSSIHSLSAQWMGPSATESANDYCRGLRNTAKMDDIRALLDDGNWHHVAKSETMPVDRNDDDESIYHPTLHQKLYIDGVLIADESDYVCSGTGFSSSSTTDPFVFGGPSWTSSAKASYVGGVAQVAIFEATRTQVQIQQLMNDFTGCTGSADALVCWELQAGVDENSITDSSPGGQHRGHFLENCRNRDYHYPLTPPPAYQLHYWTDASPSETTLGGLLVGGGLIAVAGVGFVVYTTLAGSVAMKSVAASSAAVTAAQFEPVKFRPLRF